MTSDPVWKNLEYSQGKSTRAGSFYPEFPSQMKTLQVHLSGVTVSCLWEHIGRNNATSSSCVFQVEDKTMTRASPSLLKHLGAEYQARFVPVIYILTLSDPDEERRQQRVAGSCV